MGRVAMGRHRGSWVRSGLVVAGVAIVAAACSSSPSTSTTTTASSSSSSPTTTSGGSASSPGVTKTAINVGAISTRTGAIASDFDGLSPGIQAYFDMINAEGGINGRKLLLSLQP